MTSTDSDLLDDSTIEPEEDEEDEEETTSEEQSERGTDDDDDNDNDTDDDDEPLKEEKSKSLPPRKQQQQQSQQKQQHQHQQKPPKPEAVQRQMDKSGRQRPPRSSIEMKPIEKYSEVGNPTDKFLPKGQEPSRVEELSRTGELLPYNRKQLLKEYGRMQATRNAFIAWQAQRDDYVIYQNAGYDEEKGMDRWTPEHYQLNPLTTGQHFRIDRMSDKMLDLRRAIQLNDATVKNPNSQARKAEISLLKLKLELYFRMYIGKYYHKETGEEVELDDPDGVLESEDEFERASWQDVRDMVEAAEWAFQWVPRSRRIKPSADSGSKAETEYDMIR